MDIVSTVARPDLVDVAAEWIWSAFWEKSGYALADIRALVLTSDATVGPNQCLIGLVDGEPVGTAGLIACDLDARPELTPWLAAMYVRPDARGRGYALRLIRAVEDEAAKAGYDGLWLYTFRAEGLYLKAGWRTVERIQADGEPAALMRRHLRHA